MRDELNDLLIVNQDKVDGLLARLDLSDCDSAENIDVNFYYIRIRDGEVREKDLISFLHNLIIPYCLERKKYENIKELDVVPLYLEAKRKFLRPSDQSKTGEPGELLAYYLIEGCLAAPKIITKMALKTSGQMPIHGSDGVHFGLDKGGAYTLFFAESKMYKRYDQAVTEALASVSNLMVSDAAETDLDFEIDLVGNHLDVPPGPLREVLLRVLNPYNKERDDLRYCHVCLICFERSYLPYQSTKEFIPVYQKVAEAYREYVVKKIESDGTLKKMRWIVFFIPIQSVDSFRTHFLKAIGA